MNGVNPVHFLRVFPLLKWAGSAHFCQKNGQCDKMGNFGILNFAKRAGKRIAQSLKYLPLITYRDSFAIPHLCHDIRLSLYDRRPPLPLQTRLSLLFSDALRENSLSQLFY